MESIVGRCKFCGFERGVFAENKLEADEAVAKACSCGGYEREMDKERKKFELKRELGRLMEEDENGEFASISADILNEIYKIGTLIIEEQMEKVMFNIGTEVITITGGQKIKVRRRKKVEKYGEIQ